MDIIFIQSVSLWFWLGSWDNNCSKLFLRDLHWFWSLYWFYGVCCISLPLFNQCPNIVIFSLSTLEYAYLFSSVPGVPSSIFCATSLPCFYHGKFSRVLLCKETWADMCGVSQLVLHWPKPCWLLKSLLKNWLLFWQICTHKCRSVKLRHRSEQSSLAGLWSKEGNKGISFGQGAILCFLLFLGWLWLVVLACPITSSAFPPCCTGLQAETLQLASNWGSTYMGELCC